MRFSRTQVGAAGVRRGRWRRALVIAMVFPLVAGVLFGLVPSRLSDVATAAVPAPDATHAVITVKVGGDRLANGAVSGLAGLELSLYGAGTATTVGSAIQGASGAKLLTSYPAAAWSVCTSDAAGDCSFVIPIRPGAISSTGVPQDSRFWIVQDPGDASPAGYYSNPQMRLGGFGLTPEYTWDYRFRTDTQLRANTTYTSTAPMTSSAAYLDADLGFMRNREASNAEGDMGDNVGRTTGVWSQSRVNPTLPAKCGLRVAMVTDTSGSLGTTGMTTFKSAMDTFVDAFRGTPTTMSLFSFSTTSPGSGGTNNLIALPVATAAQAATYKAQYASWASGGGTNWDQGLAAAANSGNTYDLVVMLTDGNPTVMGAAPGAGASAYNAMQDVDAGIFSANQLKASGARVVAIGAGPALSTASELNLRAVSGTSANSDYYRVTNLSDAAAVMANLANANCQGSVQVQKMIVPTNGTVAQATPAPAGWQFNAASQQPANVTVNAPASATTTSTSNGTVNFGLTFTNPATTGNVQVTETQQAGYSLVPVSGQNAVCTNTNTGASVPVTNVASATNPGFTVNSQSGAQILCKIYNTIPPAPGALVVAKTSNPASGTVVNPGADVTYTLSFQNTGGLPVTVDYTDYLDNVLDDATWKSGPTVTGTGLTATRATTPVNNLSVTGSVTAGQTVTVSYTVTAKSGTTGDGILLNMLGPTTGTPPTTCTPTTDPAWACTVHPIKGSFSLVKSSVPASGAQVSPGDTITYKVIAQDANGPVTGVVIKDDLTTVLNNATFVPGSAKLTIGTSAPISVPDPTGTNPILLQSAPFNLATGQSATLTYQVTVKANAWSKTLVNVVTGFSEGNVPPTSCAPCTTTHATPAMLLIEKIGESSSSTWVPMDGSSWAVFNDNAGQQGTPYSGTGITPVLPKAVGMFQLQNIPAGTYWLTETSAPAGFNLLAEPVQFTIAANGAVSIGQGAGGGVVTAGDLNGTGIFTITIRDVPALQLPESGGTGTLPFLAGGSVLLLASAALFIGSQRRRRTQGMDAV